MIESKMPIGIEEFSELRSKNYYYVDKTGLIEELIRFGDKVNLITRPRRFGKSLNMSMLTEFFDIRKNSKEYFEGLKVMGNEKLCKEWMNQRPVLSLTFNGVEGGNFQDAYGVIQNLIADLCAQHAYLDKSPHVTKKDKKRFRRLLKEEGSNTDVILSIKTLMQMMEAGSW